MKSKIDKLTKRVDRIEGPSNKEPIILQVLKYIDRTHYRMGEKYIYHPGGKTEVIQPEHPDMIHEVDK